MSLDEMSLDELKARMREQGHERGYLVPRGASVDDIRRILELPTFSDWAISAEEVQQRIEELRR